MHFEFVGFQNWSWQRKRRLNKIALKWWSDHLESINEVDKPRVLTNLKKFKVYCLPTTRIEAIYPAEWTTRQLAKMSDMIPWEVVGEYEIHLFMVDSDNDFIFEQNVITMTHGLGHALLYCYDNQRRVELTVDDASGNKKGDELKWFVAAVHNRTSAIEKVVQRPSDDEKSNQIYYLQTYREFFPRIWRKVAYRVWDFRDDVR